MEYWKIQIQRARVTTTQISPEIYFLLHNLQNHVKWSSAAAHSTESLNPELSSRLRNSEVSHRPPALDRR